MRDLTSRRKRLLSVAATAALALTMLLSQPGLPGPVYSQGGPPATQDPPVAVPGEGSRAFPETAKTVSGLFLRYWQEHGGLMQFGYPISDPIGEPSELARGTWTVQYFERALLEFHPELLGSPFAVLQAHLGRFEYERKYPNGAPNQRPNGSAGSVHFPETGKRLGGRFLEYYRANGGLLINGFPLSDEFDEISELNGKTYRVQYFERTVFELHPENNPPYDVLLSQLGTLRYRARYAPEAPIASPTARPVAAPTATAAAAAGSWSKARPMPSYRAEHGAAALGGKIYVVSGFAGSSPRFQDVATDLEVYDPAADRWSKAAPIPEQLHHASVAALDGRVYVTGGYEIQRDVTDWTRWRAVASTWVYDPASDNWSRASDMPEARGAHASVAVGGKLYVVGGMGPYSTSPRVYDPATDRWDTSAPKMSAQREHLAAVALEGKLYVIGGRWGALVPSVEVYDPATRSWSMAARMPRGRSGYTAGVLDGRIHVVGGENLAINGVIPGHDVYDPKTNTWQSFAAPVTMRHAQSSATLEGRWYVIGGGTLAAQGTYNTLSNEVDVFAP